MYECEIHYIYQIFVKLLCCRFFLMLWYVECFIFIQQQNAIFIVYFVWKENWEGH